MARQQENQRARMRSARRGYTLVWQLAAVVLLACTGWGSMRPHAAGRSWQDSFLEYAQEQSGAENAAFYLIHLDEDDVPEMIINYGSAEDGEEIILWSNDCTVSWTYAYYGCSYIPGESCMRIRGGREGSYYDEVYHCENGAFSMAGAGSYVLQRAAPEYDENGYILMNDQFSYSWNSRRVSAEEYLQELTDVFDETGARSPYENPYDLVELIEAIRTGSYPSLDDEKYGQGGMETEMDSETGTRTETETGTGNGSEIPAPAENPETENSGGSGDSPSDFWEEWPPKHSGFEANPDLITVYDPSALPETDTQSTEVTVVVPETAADDAGNYIIPDSNSRYLTRDDLARFSDQELRLARNEIYARRGRLFTDKELQDYFNSRSWYNGTIPADSFDEKSILNAYELANAYLILDYEKNR